MGGVAVERQRIAGCKVVAVSVDLDYDCPLLHVQEFSGAVAVRLAVVTLTGRERPVLQFDHIRRLRARDQHALAACFASPEGSALPITGEFRGARSRGFHEGWQPDAERVRESQQGAYAWIHCALLDVYEHAAAHPGVAGELIERPSPGHALLLDPCADRMCQWLCARVHTVHDTALCGQCSYSR